MRTKLAHLLYRIAIRVDPAEPIAYTTKARRLDADYPDLKDLLSGKLAADIVGRSFNPRPGNDARY